VLLEVQYRLQTCGSMREEHPVIVKKNHTTGSNKTVIHLGEVMCVVAEAYDSCDLPFWIVVSEG